MEFLKCELNECKCIILISVCDEGGVVVNDVSVIDVLIGVWQRFEGVVEVVIIDGFVGIGKMYLIFELVLFWVEVYKEIVCFLILYVKS